MTPNHFLYYLTWTIGLVGFAVAWLLVRGQPGRALHAIRDSEIAAVSSGVSLALYKTLAFGICGVYAGVAGSLLAMPTAFVNPLSFRSSSRSILVGAAVGGLGSLWGLVLGALFVQYLPTVSTTSRSGPECRISSSARRSSW